MGAGVAELNPAMGRRIGIAIRLRVSSGHPARVRNQVRMHGAAGLTGEEREHGQQANQ